MSNTSPASPHWKSDPKVLAILAPEFKAVDDMPDWIVKFGAAVASCAGASQAPTSKVQDALKGGQARYDRIIRTIGVMQDEGSPTQRAVDAKTITWLEYELGWLGILLDVVRGASCAGDAAPSKDSARLDWLEQAAKRRSITFGWLDPAEEELAVYEEAGYELPEHDDGSFRILGEIRSPAKLRDAIDAAMSFDGTRDHVQLLSAFRAHRQTTEVAPSPALTPEKKL